MADSRSGRQKLDRPRWDGGGGGDGEHGVLGGLNRVREHGDGESVSAMVRRGSDIGNEQGIASASAFAPVEFEYVSLHGLGFPVLGHMLVALRMARRALALEPDVVHAFKPKAYSGIAATLLWLRRTAGRARPAIVVDTDDWEGPGGWNAIEPYSEPMRRFFTWQERWGLTHADSVTVASRTLEALAWSMGVPHNLVAYLPNAVDDSGGRDSASADLRSSNRFAEPASPSDVPRSTESAQPSPGAPPSLLLFTRFHDHDLIRPLDVLERVRERVPGTRLIVAGRGLFGEEVDLIREAAARGLGDAVEFVGWVESEAAAAQFEAADVAIAPFDDTLVNRARSSMKLIDLLGAGLPVVAEAVGEARELIADGRTGRLVPSGDSDAFAEAVIELLLDSKARANMGRAAIEGLERDHVWSRRVERLEAAYFTALDGRGLR